MTHTNIKLNDLALQWKEIEQEALPEIKEYLRSGTYIKSIYVDRFEASWSSYVDYEYSIMTSSGTSAYEVCLSYFEYDPIETCVLLQNNTWASILWTTKKLGYHYDFIDCDEYLQYSVSELENWLKINRSKYTYIILVPTHILGHPCDMASILTLANKYDINIIEDCSQAHGAACRAGAVGHFGDIAFWSLYPGKNLGATSQAGIISVSNQAQEKLVRAFVNCGMVEKNNFYVESSNHRPCEISAITLYHKLKLLDNWTNIRIGLANYYNSIFNQSINAPYCIKNVYHYYYLMTKNRDAVVKALNDNLIPYSINYPFTLNSLENKNGHFPNSMRQSKEIICLPCHQYLSKSNIDFIADVIKKEI